MGQECLKEAEGLTKGLLYYTSNDCNDNIATIVRENLLSIGLPIVSVSLKPLDFGTNIVLDMEKSVLTMYRQQVAGLEALNTDIVFFVEHDVIYPKCHFDFIPERKDVFYYDVNWWKVRMRDGKTAKWNAIQVSGLCAYRDLLLEHYKRRVKRTEKRFSRRVGFEPGLHQYPRGIDEYGFEIWESEIPYIDFVHDKNVTRHKFKPDIRLNQLVLSDRVPYWGRTKGRVNEFLTELRGVCNGRM